ncbi:hypothetical protein [Myxococcus sp. Y35]|uniref:hypothetical protein n=1 Tax=Pseudomyxococcus flavus TaxID=3115648 RepID=UPI003CF86B62
MSLVLLGPLLLNTLFTTPEPASPAPTTKASPRVPGLDVAASPTPPTHPAEVHDLTSPLPWLGLMLDVGVPEGAGASLAFRPLRMLRLHGGLVHNGIALGARAGVSFIPWQGFVRPTLTAEAGRLPEQNARATVERFVGALGPAGLLLERVGYDFANAHLGLEVGSPRRFSFFLRGGLSYVRADVHGVQPWSEARNADVTVERITTPRVSGTLPTIKLGFLLYLG